MSIPDREKSRLKAYGEKQRVLGIVPVDALILSLYGGSVYGDFICKVINF
jgi:hypothetical protein